MTVGEAFICDYIRTPIGRFQGALSSLSATKLGSIAVKAAPQLRQARAREAEASLEHLAGHLARGVVGARPLHAQRNQGVVMGPDRAVMVAHRVERARSALPVR